jgi:hypothetical protein
MALAPSRIAASTRPVGTEPGGISMTELHPEVAAVTERVVARSRETRRAYLDLIAREREAGVRRGKLACGNLAHGFAAAGEDKVAIRDERTTMNIGIVTAYNDMLSAHQPYGRYPEQIKLFARERGATAVESAIVSRENSDSSMPLCPCVTPSHMAGVPPATCAVAPRSRANSLICSG